MKSAGARVPLVKTCLLARRVQDELPADLVPAPAPAISTTRELDKRTKDYNR
jgi:hypothetical protein